MLTEHSLKVFNNIMKRSILDNPSFLEVVKMVKKMMQEPTQKVIHGEILKKLVAIEDDYNEHYKPLTDIHAKTDTLSFLLHLRDASIQHNLTIEDSDKLEKMTGTLPFLMQENILEKAFKTVENSMQDLGHEHKRSGLVRKSIVMTSTTNANVTDVYPTPAPDNVKAHQIEYPSWMHDPISASLYNRQ
uniref:Uncharacterized protein n=1 Tax=Caenorhabditis tropicalis TaxID=1561998 RepID=A0A1I7U0V2_9PELO